MRDNYNRDLPRFLNMIIYILLFLSNKTCTENLTKLKHRICINILNILFYLFYLQKELNTA